MDILREIMSTTFFLALCCSLQSAFCQHECPIQLDCQLLYEIKKNRNSKLDSSSIIKNFSYRIQSLCKHLPKQAVNGNIYYLEYTDDTGTEPINGIIWGDGFYIKYLVKKRIKLLAKGETLSYKEQKLVTAKQASFISKKVYPDSVIRLPLKENVLSVISCSNNNGSSMSIETKFFYD